ncbi:MAG TPA: NAD(P)(+) transhydrogenase (Re/Si-specific) subunit beta [Polyangiales bacterium]|jgi:NAD(P) transhydrogenase subunit beta|nr:NAD(P)(+) transhydrogenase (Re/Si-specific) subunit beta [Polyangiales bacterium]
MSSAVQYVYLASAALFILSLKWMGQVKTARRGNWAGASAMVLAVVGTLIGGGISGQGYLWIAGAMVVGAAIGTPMAIVMPMTAVPQRTALSHAFGGLAAALVGVAEYLENREHLSTFTVGALSAEMLLGFLTFTGSLFAFGKLQEIISTRPVVYPGRNIVSLGTLVIAVLSGVYLTIDPSSTLAFGTLIATSLAFGVFLIIPIGGADMPTVIAILNAYAGLSASAMGFVMNNKLLIIAGALDGTSGLILSILMCKAMNRSFANVLFAGVGAVQPSKGGAKAPGGKTIVGYSIEDAKAVLEDTRLVIIVPGYGMAVAQAQHAVKELANVLAAQGTDVKFAIHPVAGRMPGHMNVLLSEADVPYDQLWEMERVNSSFPEADVAIVVGANDVTNPAARTNKESPLYGMPILDVDKARTVIFIKRSMNPGFAGVDNELFLLDKTMMVFGDAKKVMTDLIAAFKEGAH